MWVCSPCDEVWSLVVVDPLGYRHAGSGHQGQVLLLVLEWALSDGGFCDTQHHLHWWCKNAEDQPHPTHSSLIWRVFSRCHLVSAHQVVSPHAFGFTWFVGFLQLLGVCDLRTKIAWYGQWLRRIRNVVHISRPIMRRDGDTRSRPDGAGVERYIVKLEPDLSDVASSLRCELPSLPGHWLGVMRAWRDMFEVILFRKLVELTQELRSIVRHYHLRYAVTGKCGFHVVDNKQRCCLVEVMGFNPFGVVIHQNNVLLSLHVSQVTGYSLPWLLWHIKLVWPIGVALPQSCTEKIAESCQRYWGNGRSPSAGCYLGTSIQQKGHCLAMNVQILFPYVIDVQLIVINSSNEKNHVRHYCSIHRSLSCQFGEWPSAVFVWLCMEINREETKLMTNNTNGITTEMKVRGHRLETVPIFKLLVLIKAQSLRYSQGLHRPQQPWLGWNQYGMTDWQQHHSKFKTTAGALGLTIICQ